MNYHLHRVLWKLSRRYRANYVMREVCHEQVAIPARQLKKAATATILKDTPLDARRTARRRHPSGVRAYEGRRATSAERFMQLATRSPIAPKGPLAVAGPLAVQPGDTLPIRAEVDGRDVIIIDGLILSPDYLRREARRIRDSRIPISQNETHNSLELGQK